MAYGPLGLTPDQFWGLTPREFAQLQEGFVWREEAEHDKRCFELTQLICNLGQFKHRPRPQKVFDQLRGRRSRLNGGPAPGDAERVGEIARAARERFRHLPGRSANGAEHRSTARVPGNGHEQVHEEPQRN